VGPPATGKPYNESFVNLRKFFGFQPESLLKKGMAQNKTSIGCGVFLVLAGFALLAERMGWIPFDIAWFLPTVLVAVGIAKIFDALR